MVRGKRQLRLNKGRDASPYFFTLLILLILTVSAFAGDEPFTGPANWGGTGLMETPTARVQREGRARFGVSQANPYRYYYGSMSVFSGLEVGGRVTQLLGVPGFADNTDYGDYKDKAIDVKYQFLSEGRWRPAMALGLMDPHGTRLFTSQYVVASKQIYPFDFTIGFGNGRFGKQPLPQHSEGGKVEILTDNAAWRSDGQFFGGVQYAASDRLSLMVEYNPIPYEKQIFDPAVGSGLYFTEPVPSRFNFGLRWRPREWLETAISYQRGNQLGVNLSAAFDMGVPMIPLYDYPYQEKPEYRLYPWEERIARGLDDVGFKNIIIRRDGDLLMIEAENKKYYYTPRALGVMLRTLADLSPAEVRQYHIVIAKNGIPTVSLKCLREDVVMLSQEKMTLGEFLAQADINTQTAAGLRGKLLYRKWWDYGLNPSLLMFLNDPSGFFRYRFGARGWLSAYPWKGMALVTGLEVYPLNTVSSSIAPTNTAVRSDSVAYLQDQVVLGVVMAEQTLKLPREIYGRLAAGILEFQYSGFDGELAKPFFGGRLMAGLSGSWVKKREPASLFGFKENDFKSTYKTAFLNTRLNFPEIEAAVTFKTGQFLAGDRGTQVMVSKFINGVVLFAWYSLTNTSMFNDPENRGYSDKGIGVSLPLRLFSGTDSKTSYKFGLSPWTRDVGQDIDHFNSLFDTMGRDVPLYLKKDALSQDSRGAGLWGW